MINVAQMKIREMQLTDLTDVHAVDQASFSAPWSKETYKREITDNRYAHYFVIEADGEVVGYAGLWLVMDDAQITNIAITPKFRGYKIGEKLFGYVVQYAINLGAKRLSLEVRKSNKVAQNMYRKFGLVSGGVRKNYYPDNGEDALVMWVEFK